MDLWGIEAVDQHAHNLFKPDVVGSDPYCSYFTESMDPLLISRHARHTLFFLRSLRDIAELLECDATEEAIVSRRGELDFADLCERCFKASRLAVAFLDDGFLPEKTLTMEWHERFLPVKRILRLEHLAETLMETADSFDILIERFLAEIDPPKEGLAAFKTIAAYRTGLNVSLTSKEAARQSYTRVEQEWRGKRPRLSDKALIDYLLISALDVASKYEIPVQFHTGFGDPDLDLRLSNPLHLRPLLEEKRWRQAPFVLLHAGYPFVREAGYLASVHAQVYVDFGLAVPFLSTSGIQVLLQQLMELTPISKLMFSSDGHAVPELYYLGAKCGRDSLGKVLERAVMDRDLTVAEAEWAAESILAENAREIYGRTWM